MLKVRKSKFFRLNVYYPPPYERKVWHYQVSLFNKTIIKILSKHIPHEIITIDDRDVPWFDKIDKKNKAWRLYVRSNKNNFFLNNLLTSNPTK